MLQNRRCCLVHLFKCFHKIKWKCIWKMWINSIKNVQFKAYKKMNRWDGHKTDKKSISKWKHSTLFELCMFRHFDQINSEKASGIRKTRTHEAKKKNVNCVHALKQFIPAFLGLWRRDTSRRTQKSLTNFRMSEYSINDIHKLK